MHTKLSLAGQMYEGQPHPGQSRNLPVSSHTFRAIGLQLRGRAQTFEIYSCLAFYGRVLIHV